MNAHLMRECLCINIKLSFDYLYIFQHFFSQKQEITSCLVVKNSFTPQEIYILIVNVNHTKQTSGIGDPNLHHLSWGCTN